MLLQLSGVEFEVVSEVLRRAMRELREEIYKTEALDFEPQLKRRELVLEGVLKKIATAEASGLVVGEPATKH